jgi:acyl-CoA synthetase (AMP-forming)/AMP-acid ligase II
MDTVRHFIDRYAEQCAKDVWLISPDSDRIFTYGDLGYEVHQIAAGLDQLGVTRGAKVSFLAENGGWTALVHLAIMASGRVVVPLNAVAGDIQLRHVLQHSDTQIAFVAPAFREKLTALLGEVPREIKLIDLDPVTGPAWPDGPPPDDRANPEPATSDPALLLYTSGSTGLPKGAVLSHRAIINGGRNVVTGHNLTKSDRALCVLPIYHINGAMVTVAAPLVSGGSVVMPSRFRASTFWPLVAQYQCTWSSVVPTIIKYLLDRADQEPYDFGHDERLRCFRFGRSASAPLPVVMLEQWRAVFDVPMIETLGLTETAGTVACNPMPPGACKPGSVGIAVGNEIKVIDDDGQDCAPSVTGEIVIRGDNLLDYYYQSPDVTKSAFVQGWFRTGDLGMLDEDAYLFITGRLKELIIRGGENIAPREIDDVLYRHDAILEAAAVGVDDENYGQEVVACVVRRDGHDCSEQELKLLCENAVGKVKTPKHIYFMDDLPKGPSGKILRLKLPDMISSMSSTPSQPEKKEPSP